MECVTLNNGVAMPILGLGTWKMRPDEAQKAVRDALEIGYRHIDTATIYGNEEGVGKAIRESGIAREEIFVTTKLFPSDFFAPEKAFEKSLSRLSLEYVDLYLIHWPIPLMSKSIWQTLEKIYGQKRARAIGISNYYINDVEKLLSYAKVLPAVDQVKFSPFDYQEDLLEYCLNKKIVLEAYSPLGRGNYVDNPSLAALGKKYGKTAAQILIRWCTQNRIVVIPKSTHPERMKENFAVFDWQIEDADMNVLDAMSRYSEQ